MGDRRACTWRTARGCPRCDDAGPRGWGCGLRQAMLWGGIGVFVQMDLSCHSVIGQVVCVGAALG